MEGTILTICEGVVSKVRRKGGEKSKNLSAFTLEVKEREKPPQNHFRKTSGNSKQKAKSAEGMEINAE